jgi:hypothetical protein
MGLAFALGAVGTLAFAVEEVGGVLLLCGLTAQVAGLVLLLGALFSTRSGDKFPPFASRLLLAVVSLGIAFMLGELMLSVIQDWAPPKLKPKIPDELARRKIEGSRDFYWLNALHAHNSKGFRTHSFSEPRKDVFRIALLGDSLTYGKGLPAEQRFGDLIEQELGQRYRVEVLNLGRPGASSEDIVRLAKKHLPKLQPDLVLYGHCLNDFLRASGASTPATCGGRCRSRTRSRGH